MTKPILPRLGYAERKSQRAAFAELKRRVDASPSMATYRAANRRRAAADRARKKIMRAVLGEPVRPLTPREYAAINAGLQAQATAAGLKPP